MLFKRLMTACAVLSFLTIPVAIAATSTTQTTGSEQGTEAVDPLNDTITVPTWPQTSVALPPDSEAVAGEFSLGAIEGIDPNLLSNVTAKGFARKVDAEGQEIGQVLITSVEKNGKEVAISSQGFAAQFDASDADSLDPNKKYNVEGSRAALIAALEALNTEEDEEKEEEYAPSDTSSSNTSTGEGTGNDEAASYSTPSAIEPVTEEDAPVTDTRVTTENCEIRMDWTTGDERAVVQSRIETLTDGAVTDPGTCTDSEKSYKLNKRYQTDDDVNIEAIPGTARSRFQWYYTDGSGENHDVGEIVIENDPVFVVNEDTSKCADFADFTMEPPSAVPQAALTYLNRNNTEVQARGCEASVKEDPIPMKEDLLNCDYRPEYDEGANGFMYEQSMWTYMRDGVTIQAAPCADTGRKFEIRHTYVKDGAYVCPFLNITKTSVVQQYRQEITVDGVDRYVSECTPDETTTPVTSTTDGCNNPANWPASNHNLELGQSIGQHRFFFIDDKGQKQYVTGCVNSEVIHNHDATITNWDEHDEALWAYALNTVTIDVPGYGEYVVRSNTLLPGTAQTPYIYLREEDVRNGTTTYEGCNALYETTRSEVYERPNGTTYPKPIGPGNQQGPEDVCAEKVETATYLRVSSPTYNNSAQVPIGSNVSYTQVNIQRTVKTNPVTNEVFNGTVAVTGTSGGGGSPTAKGNTDNYTGCGSGSGRFWSYSSQCGTGNDDQPICQCNVYFVNGCSGPWKGSSCSFSPADAINW